jgi:hypothetical protein
VEGDAIALVSDMDNLGTEGGADELRPLLARDLLEQGGHGGTVLRIQVCVHFVEDDERTRLGRLERKDEAERAET